MILQNALKHPERGAGLRANLGRLTAACRNSVTPKLGCRVSQPVGSSRKRVTWVAFWTLEQVC